MEIRKSPEKNPKRQRAAVVLFLVVGACTLASVAISQHRAADRAKAILDSAANLADAIVDLGDEGPAQTRHLAWEVSRLVRARAGEGAVGMAELEQINHRLREGRAATTAEARHHALEQIARIAEGPAAPRH